MATQNAELTATVQKSIDGKQYKLVGLQHLPYTNAAQYLSTVTNTRRHIGQIGFIAGTGDLVEIWQFQGGIADENFVKIFPQDTGGSATLQDAFDGSITAEDDPLIDGGTSELTISSAQPGTGNTHGTLKVTNTANGNALTAISEGTAAALVVVGGGTQAGIVASNPGATGISASGTSGLVGNGNSVGVWGQSGSGIGITGTSTTGTPASFAANPATTNSVVKVIDIQRTTSGTAANGIGASIGFTVEAASGSSFEANTIISKLTNATDVSRTSELSFAGLNSATTNVLLSISGAGLFTLPLGLPNYANDAAAAAGTPAVPVNGLYRNASGVQIRVS